MYYEAMGRAHAALAACGRGARGQGTVEYVGLMLLIAVVLAAVVKAGKDFSDGGGIAKAVVGKLQEAIEGVGSGK